jgi:hypothetical protein
MSVNLFISFSGLLVLAMGCGNNISEGKIQTSNSGGRINESEVRSAYIKFRSFQNSDSTWGFTIFVNSRPFLHYRKIPLTGANKGFMSKNDAEKVAGIFVRMIQAGDYNPELNKKSLDSLEILMNK